MQVCFAGLPIYCRSLVYHIQVSRVIYYIFYIGIKVSIKQQVTIIKYLLVLTKSNKTYIEIKRKNLDLLQKQNRLLNNCKWVLTKYQMAENLTEKNPEGSCNTIEKMSQKPLVDGITVANYRLQYGVFYELVLQSLGQTGGTIRL